VVSRSKSAAIWILIGVATIAVVAGIALLLHRSGLLGARAPEGDALVAVDDQYAVFLSQIEVEQRKASGRKWDARANGPDVRYEVHWRGSRIFKSSVRKDTLLARWDPDEVRIGDLVDGLSPEGTMKAARITARPGEILEFRVVEDDAIANDEIGRWQVAVDSLHVGDQIWTAPAPGVRQATCRVVRLGPKGR
jgi:hypothetical protein